ncbi:MAG TPA: hypothetical protein VFX29_01850 [Longimicrobiaceae bacterium]|nr:hypothetical protein [Longimicrobiaceae bacterium]
MSSPKKRGKRPELVPQAHGGALLAGGVKGNKGGPGRPRKEVRDDLVAILDEEGRALLRRTIRSKAKGVTLDHKLRAVELAMKYGLGTESKHEHTGEGGGPMQMHVIGPGAAPAVLPPGMLEAAGAAAVIATTTDQEEE